MHHQLLVSHPTWQIMNQKSVNSAKTASQPGHICSPASWTTCPQLCGLKHGLPIILTSAAQGEWSNLSGVCSPDPSLTAAINTEQAADRLSLLSYSDHAGQLERLLFVFNIDKVLEMELSWDKSLFRKVLPKSGIKVLELRWSAVLFSSFLWQAREHGAVSAVCGCLSICECLPGYQLQRGQTCLQPNGLKLVIEHSAHAVWGLDAVFLSFGLLWVAEEWAEEEDLWARRERKLPLVLWM